MDNQPRLDEKIVVSQLVGVSDASTKKGKFSLLDCLSILLALGILSAIALPSSLCQANRAKGSEAKQYVGSMNRAQQAYLAENGRFANSVDALGLGIKTETINFYYSVSSTNTAVYAYGLPNPSEIVYLGPFHWKQKRKQTSLRGYVGAVFTLPSTNTSHKANKDERVTVSILCVAKSSGMAKPANPTNINGKLACGEGTELVTK